MVAVRAHLGAWLATLLGAFLGAVWLMATWLGPQTGQHPLDTPVAALVLFPAMGALAQPWLSPGSTAALAAAVIAGNLLAVANSTEGDEEHFGHEVGTLLFLALVVIGVAVGLALLAHWLVGAMRARLAATGH